MALLANRLLTMMLVIFWLLVWVPLILSDAHNHTNWSETSETFAIAGAAWILANLLGEYRGWLFDHNFSGSAFLIGFLCSVVFYTVVAWLVLSALAYFRVTNRPLAD